MMRQPNCSCPGQRPAALLLLALPLLAGGAAPAGAGTDPARERVEVPVRLPAEPARNDATARRSIAMIDRAALAACGAADSSFAQMKAAVRRSACWHQAMSGAVGQSGDARLGAWWAAHPF